MGSSMEPECSDVKSFNDLFGQTGLLAEDALAGTATIQLGASAQPSRFLPPACSHFSIYSAGTRTIMD